MGNSLHPTHRTRISDASTFDEICELCGATDITCGGWGKLAEPCPASEASRRVYDEAAANAKVVREATRAAAA